jgi:thiamine pyrophosphate-dependent acetolactate synthase large subunit-like protein
MISRRSFLFISSSAPLLALIGGVSAEGIGIDAPLPIAQNETIAKPEAANFCIQGWFDIDQTISSARLIDLSSSWKSGWL